MQYIVIFQWRDSWGNNCIMRHRDKSRYCDHSIAKFGSMFKSLFDSPGKRSAVFLAESVISTTHEQNTRLNGTTHEQTIF